MQYGFLYTLVIVLVISALCIGVGVLTLDKFAQGVLTDTSKTEKGLRFYTINYTLFAEDTITASSYTALNSSDGGAVTLEFDSSSTWGATKAKLVSPASANGSLVNVTYTYGADSAATDNAQTSRDEIGNIATNWLGLIITIGVMAIILSMVLASFRPPRD